MGVAQDSQLSNLETVPTLISAPVQSVTELGAASILAQDYEGDGAEELGVGEYVKGLGSLPTVVSGRGRGGIDSKPWQQEGDWPCPNSSCSNINFSFRGICNRCGTARPAGSFPAIGGGLGCSRTRGRGPGDTGCRSGRGAGGPPGLFGPNDWNCPMCGNINWAKRTKCNICSAGKPGYNEGGAREGRGGGYKEFDQAEIEETKRRRREMEEVLPPFKYNLSNYWEDDGEMYDEFGNLKKKFRAKARTGDSLVAAALATGGTGKAGWNMEESRVAEQSKEKSKDHSYLRYDNDSGGDHKVRNYAPSARHSQHGNENGRETRRRMGESNAERYRSDFSVRDQDRVSGGAWAWERVAVKGRGGEALLELENEEQGEWLRRRKRLRERDRITD